MARRSLGVLTLDLVAKIGGFTGPLSKAERETQRRAAEMRRAIAKIGGAFTALTGISSGSLAVLVTQEAAAAKEIENLSRIANSSTQQFQKLAFASKRYGIEQDKVAGILKDVNDKVGDFLQTGAGPLADFFDNIAPSIGVTADQFRNLSGSDALQLYVSSLEKANLSQAEMTFFMEAIASDSTALLPLLKDNGEELKKLGDEAERTGNVLSDIDIGNLNKVNEQTTKLRNVFSGMRREVVIGAIPAVNDLLAILSDEATIGAARAIGNAIATAMGAAVKATREVINVTKFLGEELAATLGGAGADDIVRLEEQRDKIRETLKGGLIAQGERIRFFGKDGLVEYYSDAELKTELDKINKAIDAYYKNKASNTLLNTQIGSVAKTPPSNLSPLIGGQTNVKGFEIREYLKNLQIEVDLLGKTAEQQEVYKFSLIGANKAQRDQAAALHETIRAFGEQEKIKEHLSNLSEQVALLGTSADEQELYRLRVEGATDAQIKQAMALREAVSAFEAQKEIQEDYKNLLSELRTEDEKLTDQLKMRLDILGAIGDLTDAQRNEVASRIAGAAFSPAPETAGVSTEIAGPFGELAKLDESAETINQWYDDQLSRLQGFRASYAELNSQWDDEEARLREEHQARLAEIDQARALTQLSASEEFFGNLAGITEAFVGKESKTYRALFALEKAAGIARGLVAVNTAIAQASTSAPFPANLGAIAAVVSATAGLVGAIQGVQIQGQAHDGIDSVKETGSYYLQKGERVSTAETSAKLDRTLDRVNTSMEVGQQAPPPQNVTVFAVLNESMIPEIMKGREGEKVVITHFQKNKQGLK